MEDLNSLVATLNAEINNDMNSKELDALWEEDPTEAAKVDRRIQKRKNTIQQAQQKLRDHQQAQFQEILREEQKKLHLRHPEIADPIKGATVKSNIMNYLSSKGFSNEDVARIYDSRYFDVIMDGMNFNKSKSNITSGGLGTMGFALPAALGAKIGDPGREVIAVIGDGGFQMTIQELGTIFQTSSSVKIVILNNEYLGMVRQWQQLFFDKRYASTEMTNPDFVTISKGYFIESKRVSHRNELNSSIKQMLSHDGPYLLEVCVEKEENVFPMIPSGSSVSDIRLE